MSPATRVAAMLKDLYRTEGKAELIGGRIVHLMPTGLRPNRAAFRIARSLDDHAEATGVGEVYTDKIGFAVPLLTSGRQSFSPDAAYFAGPFPANEMRFLVGAPNLAVEVRSENDYGTAAEATMAAKRADYFEAGTLVVWDVDLEAGVVRKYQANAHDQPTIFGIGDQADSEPAVPGWRMDVARIFA